ncbi:hypothetical protein BBAD15_g29 [Beauveria bassiana D1-5]|uniref:Uncharacterized protein n=1 Tax=Beauveria bassiana D1-5 TaxID=1245745 RepID=A0A0A2W284_BEABA|nr:hypothetical protein BBAD15_g29 [Beauveria bassiana D1-5]
MIVSPTVASQNGVTRQVDQRGHREGNKVTGNDVGAHPGDKHLRQQLTAVEQHRLDAGRDTNPEHFPQNRPVERREIAFQRNAQRRVKANHQHEDNARRANVAGNGQPQARANEAQPAPAKDAVDKNAADDDVKDVHAAVNQQRDFGVTRPAQRAAADKRNRRRRVAPDGSLQVGKRQTFYLRRGVPGDNIDDVRARQVNACGHNKRHDGHQNKRLSGRRPRPLRIQPAEAECHHYRGAKIDSGEERHNNHVKAVGEPYARHRLFP